MSPPPAQSRTSSDRTVSWFFDDWDQRARLRKHQLIRARCQQKQSSHGGHGVHGLTAAIDQWLKSPPWLRGLRARPDRYESLSAILTISDQTGPLKAINSLLPTRAVRAT